MTGIKLKVNTDKDEVEEFLAQLHEILDSEGFDAERDITVIISMKSPDAARYSTYYTLIDLGYDTADIISRLRELSVTEFSERIIDVDDLDPPALFVFGKMINKKQVYIKLKIKDNKKTGRVLVVSFHYAEHEMIFPLA